MKWRVPVPSTLTCTHLIENVDQRKLGEIVEKDCQMRGLNGEDAMDRIKWMKQIRDD